MIRDYFDLVVNRGLHPDEAAALAKAASTTLYFRNSSRDKFRVHPDGKWQYLTAGETRAADFTWAEKPGEINLYFSEESARAFRSLDKEHVKKLKESAAEWSRLAKAAEELLGDKPDEFSSLKELFGKGVKAGKNADPKASFSMLMTTLVGKEALSRCLYYAHTKGSKYAAWLCSLLASNNPDDLFQIWKAANQKCSGTFYTTFKTAGFELSYNSGSCTVAVRFGTFLPGQVDNLCTVLATANDDTHRLYSDVLQLLRS